jgi:broad specificity phosphatase PhoE
MKVYLIRHAQSVENARGLQYRMSPTAFNAFLRHSPDAPLSALGVQQAQRVAGALAGAPIERLYSSPFERSVATATIVGCAFGLQPQIVPDLREVMPCALAESPREAALSRLFVRGYLRLIRPAPAYESWLATYRRARRVWRIMTDEPAEAIAVVSHFAFLHVLLFAVHAQSPWPPHRYDFSNGGVTCIEVCHPHRGGPDGAAPRTQ